MNSLSGQDFRPLRKGANSCRAARRAYLRLTPGRKRPDSWSCLRETERVSGLHLSGSCSLTEFHHPQSHAMHTITRSVLFVSLAASAAFAQTGSVVVSTTLSPRSVHPTTGNHVLCSMTQSGRQIVVDASILAAPAVVGTPYNPVLSDQYGDSVYTGLYGGRLIAGYRWGGLNMLDASGLPVLSTATTTSTTYHHEGLDIFDTPIASYLAYSEQNTSSGNAGGLRIYSITATALTPVGSVLANNEAGNALVFSRYGRRIFQVGEIGGANNVRFFEYNSDSGLGFVNPTRVVDMPFPGATTRYSSSQVERNAKGSNLLVTRGPEGLHVVDTTIPFSPVINTVLQMPGLFFDGVRFFPGSNIAVVWGVFTVGGSAVDFLLFLETSIPGVAVPILGSTYPLQVADIEFKSGNVYVLGRDRVTGNTILHTW